MTGKMTEIERWGRFELVLQGPREGNPYAEQEIRGYFGRDGQETMVRGFYDGDGVYRIRFMPGQEGRWTYRTESAAPELDGHAGWFACTPAEADNHGPVQVQDEYRFAYADGGSYFPFGTTCYAWIHLDEDMQRQTLATLAEAPFNKLRMCIFPKHYAFNSQAPDHCPFERRDDGSFDFERFEPVFFAKLERRIADLQQLGIEADLILFHPYDKGRWGFDAMEPAVDESYLRYVIARLSSFRNVWWSLANEYDFMEAKTMADWDRLLQLTQAEDPYGHLRSIHNGTRMYDHDSVVFYDHKQPWITHVSAQHWDATLPPIWHRQFRKPIIVDECCYEGNLPQRWGNVTGEELVRRFWDVAARGGYCTHGETFADEQDTIWWAKGGKLHGESPERIRFLREVLEEAPEGCKPIPEVYDVPTIGIEGQYYLQYFGIHRPAYRILDLPAGIRFKAEIIDTWNMSVTEIEEEMSGTCRLNLPDKIYQAVRLTRMVGRD